MLRRLVVAYAVRTHWRLLSSDAVKVAGQKRTVARPQLGNSDALAPGPAESPVCLRVGVSSQGAMGDRVRVAFVARMLATMVSFTVLLLDSAMLSTKLHGTQFIIFTAHISAIIRSNKRIFQQM